MSADREETEKTVVKTYLPAYQKEEWTRHADELGMSQSEFVRTMVQAGRRGFLEDESDERRSSDETDVTPGVDGLEDRILDVLRSEGVCDWAELVEAVTDDVESRVEDALQSLQQENQIQYSGRDGGYTLVGDDGDA